MRSTIYEYVLAGQNANEARNYSFIKLPPIVITCKQFLAEVAPVFYKVNTFTFAVGANVKRDIRGAQELKVLSGVLGLLARQRKAALAGDSGIRLWSVKLKVWNAKHIIDVRRIIIASRKRGMKRRPSGWLFEVHLEIVGNELALAQIKDARLELGAGHVRKTPCR